MTAATRVQPTAITPEVRAFAIEKGVERYLPNVLALANRLFPSTRMSIRVEDDPELPDNREIVFEVSADNLEEEEQVELQQQGTRELFQQCPATHVHFFACR